MPKRMTARSATSCASTSCSTSPSALRYRATTRSLSRGCAANGTSTATFQSLSTRRRADVCEGAVPQERGGGWRRSFPIWTLSTSTSRLPRCAAGHAASRTSTSRAPTCRFALSLNYSPRDMAFPRLGSEDGFAGKDRTPRRRHRPSTWASPAWRPSGQTVWMWGNHARVRLHS